MCSKQIFLTYGDSKYEKSKARIVQQAKDFGFDEVHSFGPDDLSEEFKESTTLALNNNKGGGFWIWKTYCLKKIMDSAKMGDIIVYLDSGCTLNVNGKERYNRYLDLLKTSRYAILSFVDVHNADKYTKKDVFDYFGIRQGDELLYKNQIIGGVLMMMKTDHTVRLIDEYYNIAVSRPDLFIDDQIQMNQPGFIDHRHDQAIFSLLRYIRGSILHTDMSWRRDMSVLKNEPFLATRICN